VEELAARVRNLEKQRADLVDAFRKQMKLIDVLKRQKARPLAAPSLLLCSHTYSCPSVYVYVFVSYGVVEPRGGCAAAELQRGGVPEDPGLGAVSRSGGC
jgi:hypothetical protein